MRRISDYLASSEAKAKTYKELSTATGLSERELRAAIRHERRQGVAILTSKNGVWLWDGRDCSELDACYKRLIQIGRDFIQTGLLMRAGQERGAVDG